MKVLLADDHRLFAAGLESLLTLNGVDVIGAACDGLDALNKTRALRPDLILMDIQMPRLDGLAATRMIKAEMPEVKIVMLTMSENDEDLFEAIKSGACGYLLKSDESERFFKALSGLMQGDAPLSPGIAGRVLKEFARQGRTTEPTEQPPKEEGPLSPRQAKILAMVAQGLTYKEVGAKLFIAERTIKYHMAQILDRLQMENRKQVIEYARRMKFDAR